MRLSLQHFQQYTQIAGLLWKYGRSDLVKALSVSENLDTDALAAAHSGEASPRELADDLEAMGPTYIKLGQVLASRPDLLPAPYIEALARLQDDVRPFSFAEVEQIVTAELGVRISKAFSSFDEIPLATASLGQVHAATLRDGRQVVVKVQRPDIEQQIIDDMEVLAEIAEWMDAHTEFGRQHQLQSMIEEFRLVLKQELNYELEANNLKTIAKNLAGFESIFVPQPIASYTTRRVLTMDYVQGRKLTAIGPLTSLEMRGDTLAEELFHAYLKQVLVDGLFHADPHPGNVFFTDDKRIALLDLGMVGTTTPKMQECLLKILIAVSEGKSEEAAAVLIGMSRVTEAFDEVSLKKSIDHLVVQQHDQSLGDIKMGRTLLEVSQSAAQAGLFVPSELTLLGKTLMQLDQVGKLLDPRFDPNAAIRRYAADILAQRMRKQATQGSAMNAMLELRDFLTGLPVRLNKVMDVVGNSELEVKVRVVDADLIMEGLQKIANRIASGVILAALIIGAALLMQVNTRFQLFGYPGLAILCFLAAAAGGFWLLIAIFVQDQKRKRTVSR
ncbi:MAG: AarF/ABC1/UbiB kinase family protein [Thiobacillus sp.]|nr:AarF/ABC1/UbiB kinase family protein [Thiobacillus sp.]